MEKNKKSLPELVDQMTEKQAKERLRYLALILDNGEMPRISTYDLIFNQPEMWKDEASL